MTKPESVEEIIGDLRDAFEKRIDKRYGDGVGHFSNGSKTKHIADVFYEMTKEALTKS